MTGILLDENDDLLVLNGELVIGESALQSAGMVLQAFQGEFKEEPIIGANILRNTGSKINRDCLKLKTETALVRAGINLDEVKGQLEIFINNQSEIKL